MFMPLMLFKDSLPSWEEEEISEVGTVDATRLSSLQKGDDDIK